jgi:hypothetical protein
MERCSSQILSHVPLPPAWDLFRHPNGDFYFYNSEWRLLTQEDVHDPTTLGYITDAREEYLQELQDDPEASSRLPDDYEVSITDVSASAAADTDVFSFGWCGLHLDRRNRYASYILLLAPTKSLPGLQMKPREEFWTFVCEYPSHHPDLPPNAEAEFVLALNNGECLSIIYLSTYQLHPSQDYNLQRIYFPLF